MKNNTVLILLILVSLTIAGCANTQKKQSSSKPTQINKSAKVSNSTKNPTQVPIAVTSANTTQVSNTTITNNVTTKQDTSYKVYANSKYGFSIEYPSTYVITLIPDNDDGRVLSTQDGTTKLTVSGINNISNDTVLTEYEKEIQQHPNSSYKKQESNWFVLSWVEGDKIAYEKTVVGIGSMDTFMIEYPLSQEANFDSIISHINSSFNTPSLDTAH